MKKLKQRNPCIKKIEIEESDGTKKVIGKYNVDKKIFTCDRMKSEHFMRKWNAWGLDKNLVDFLANEGAIIHLNDKESKWEYECQAVDMKLYSLVEEHKQHRPQYFLPIDKWNLLKIKNHSMIMECLEKDCKNNFNKRCLRGVVSIGTNGECSNYEDRQG
jgi:hypothetical protein